MRVFVSWSHREPGWTEEQADDWARQVLTFTELLRHNGIDADVDLYHLNEHNDWTRYGPNAVRTADRTLVVVSPAWTEAFEGTGPVDRGAGATAEANVLKSLEARDRKDFIRRVRFVLFPGHRRSELPHGLDGPQSYSLASVDQHGIEDLLRDLTNQPRFARSPVGSAPQLPPVNRPTSGPSRPEPEAEHPGAADHDDPWGRVRLVQQIAGSKLTTHPAISADGGLVAAGCADGVVRVWRTADASVAGAFPKQGVVHDLALWKEEFRAVALGPDGHRVAGGARGGRTRVWDLGTGHRVVSVSHSDFGDTSPRGPIDVNDVAFSPNGRLLATASEDGTVRIWDLTRRIGKRIGTLSCGARDRVLCVAFSPNGHHLVAGSQDGKVRSRPVPGAENVVTPPAAEDRSRTLDYSMPVRALAIAPDAQHLALLLGDSIRVRTLPGGTLANPAAGEECAVIRASARRRSLTFDRSGSGLIGTNADGLLTWWPLRNGAPGAVFPGGHAGSDAALSADGSHLVAATDDVLSIWSLGA